MKYRSHYAWSFAVWLLAVLPAERLTADEPAKKPLDPQHAEKLAKG